MERNYQVKLHPEHLKQFNEAMDLVAANRQRFLSVKALLMFNKWEDSARRAASTNSFNPKILLWTIDQLKRSHATMDDKARSRALLNQMSRWVTLATETDQMDLYDLYREYDRSMPLPAPQRSTYADEVDQFLEHVGNFGRAVKNPVFVEISQRYIELKRSLKLKSWRHLYLSFGVAKTREETAFLLGTDVKNIPKMPRVIRLHLSKACRKWSRGSRSWHEVYDPAQIVSAYEIVRRVKDHLMAVLELVRRQVNPAKYTPLWEALERAETAVAAGRSIPLEVAAVATRTLRATGLDKHLLYPLR